MGTTGAMRRIGEELGGILGGAIGAARESLLRKQHPAGYWHAPLEANVGMDAQYIIFNRFIGRRPEAIERRLVEHMLATQTDEGCWTLYQDGPGHLSTTIEAYWAMKLAGLSPDEPALRRARDYILGHGGLARAQVFTRAYLAYFEQFPWWGLPAMPAELMLLPPWFPLNIYAMSSWARETVVPMLILFAKKPRIALDPKQGVKELWLREPRRSDLAFPPDDHWFSWRNFFLRLDQALKIIGKSPWKPLRRRALERAEKWILERQDRNGGWGGIQPPMLNCVMALQTLGYPKDHPAIVAGIQAIDDFLIEYDGHLIYQPCVSPTWDTALTMRALLDSGMPGDHPALRRAAEWLIDHQIFVPGDWSVYNPDLEPGGWAFEFANDWYPDVDDSAVILMVLRRILLEDRKRLDRAIARGMNWTLGMQSKNGGYGAFDTDNDSEFLNRIPFADMEAMIDPPTEDLTGRVLELMGSYGFDLDYGRARRARDFLLRTQRKDGSWWGRWGSNFIYGTWSALMGLRAIGEEPEAPHIRRAVKWLEDHQNPDGGWGETLASYDDESLAGKGPSTPSQTAWAIMGLLAGTRGISPAIERGVKYLAETQKDDGTWDERPFTGTGFPRHFYLRYTMYREYFPLMALGQVQARLAAAVTVPLKLAERREAVAVAAVPVRGQAASAG